MEGDADIVEYYIHELLKERKFSDLLTSIKDPLYQKSLKDNALNIVSSVCLLLKENPEILSNGGLTFCKDLLNILVENGNPKEVLVGLLEHADCFKEDNFFFLLLFPLQSVLFLVPGKRGKSLDWVLSVLDAHILSLPLPQNKNLEGEELLLLDLDPITQRTSEVLSAYLDFYQPFVQEVSIAVSQKKTIAYSDRIINQQKILQKYLLKLLDHPLVYHDLHLRKGKARSSLQTSCSKLINYIYTMQKNLMSLYMFPTVILQPSVGKGSDISSLARGNLAYIVLVENFIHDCYPQVYNYSYLFESHLTFLISMLLKVENLVIYKGLQLLKRLFQTIQKFELPHDSSNFDSILRLSENVLRIAGFCGAESIRFMASKLLISLVEKLNWKARYNLLMFLISLASVGAQSFAIDTYKNCLNSCLNNKSQDNYFIGKKFQTFVRHALILKDGVETDILENITRLLSGLNFLRYVLLRDSPETNITGVHDILSTIKKNYISPLREGIEITKAHYKLEKQNLKAHRKEGSSDLNVTVKAGNKILPNMPENYESEMVESALTSLDLIESVLSRVNEILDKI